MSKYKIRSSDWLKFPPIIVNFNHFFIQPAPGLKPIFDLSRIVSKNLKICKKFVNKLYRPLAVTSQLQLLSAMLEGKVKAWNTEMSTNVKRATRKRLLPDYYSILAIILNIIRVFFSKTFFVLFCFPSNMAAKYAVRHVWRHAKVVYSHCLSQVVNKFIHSLSQAWQRYFGLVTTLSLQLWYRPVVTRLSQSWYDTRL